MGKELDWVAWGAWGMQERIYCHPGQHYKEECMRRMRIDDNQWNVCFSFPVPGQMILGMEQDNRDHLMKPNWGPRNKKTSSLLSPNGTGMGRITEMAHPSIYLYLPTTWDWGQLHILSLLLHSFLGMIWATEISEQWGRESRVACPHHHHHAIWLQVHLSCS